MSSRAAFVIRALGAWPAIRWIVALATACLTYVVVAIPTDLIDTVLFSRAVPPTWWAAPTLVVSSALTGLLVATYVAREPEPTIGKAGRMGSVGAMVSFFAVGCPVCNKLVLLALGTSGALQYFEPVQPLLAVFSIGLLTWAFLRRITGEDRCALASAPPAELQPAAPQTAEKA